MLGKLTRAHWEKWPDKRREAVTRLVDAWFVQVLNTERLDGYPIDDVLCGIAHANIPLSGYLETLATRPNDLQDFAEVFAPTAFWEQRPAAARQVADFLERTTR